jgi:hypothetical protein
MAALGAAKREAEQKLWAYLQSNELRDDALQVQQSRRNSRWAPYALFRQERAHLIPPDPGRALLLEVD